MSRIDGDEVRKVATLARIALAEDEADSLCAELERVLDYVAELDELDLTDVPPTFHPLQPVAVLRPDEVRTSLSPEQALAQAPASLEGAFLVPRVLGSGERDR